MLFNQNKLQQGRIVLCSVKSPELYLLYGEMPKLSAYCHHLSGLYIFQVQASQILASKSSVMTASLIFLNFFTSCNPSPVQDSILKSSETSSITFKNILYNCIISPETKTVNNIFLKILVCPFLSSSSYENNRKPFFAYLAPVQEILWNVNTGLQKR